MKISAQEGYGLRCLIQLARAEEEVVPVAQIAEAEGLSVPYAEKLLRILNRAGIVESVRGSKGGYHLAMAADRVTLGAALRALGGFPSPATVCGHYAGQRDECVHSPSCSVRPVWAQIALYLQGMLDSMVLADLLEDEREVRAKIAEVHSAAVSTSALAVGGGFDVRSYGE